MEQQLLEMLKTHILMSKEEFVEYVNLKKFYATMSALDKSAKTDIDKYLSYKELRKKELNDIKLKNGKDTILRLAYRRDRMEYDTRKLQVDTESTYFFGFENYKKDILINELGYTLEELIDYINYEWDLKEEKEKKEKEKEEKSE